MSEINQNNIVLTSKESIKALLEIMDKGYKREPVWLCTEEQRESLRREGLEKGEILII